ncbi:hypothetical protein [Dysgonomonas sp. 520]|uniref:hypothetical protein n=1 Tax=Dysgonomonas sp. 520 TaxID=2302931 RepID=UPI0013D726A4|nr:hypothetical protein [Dysgonomonas sp. 520]NDW09139.1 hypothetical protein [Dysgonomonas sp. 520]
MKKKFIKYLFIFLLPIMILVVGMEVALRSIPNDYKDKSEYLDRHAQNIEVLLLGASHIMYGINPEFFSDNCYNAAYVSQSLDFDYDILMKYDEQWNNLKYIILPMSYCTMTERLETIDEWWRIKNYLIYYRVGKAKSISDYTEVSGNKLDVNLKRLYKYFFNNESPVTCEENGWIKKPFKLNNNLEKDGKRIAKKHTIDDPECVRENTEILRNIIQYAKRKDIKVILVTTPTHKGYYENLNKSQWEMTKNIANLMVKDYDNTYFYDYLSDTSFTEYDLADCNHLNEYGAKKLSLRLDSIIHTLPD